MHYASLLQLSALTLAVVLSPAHAADSVKPTQHPSSIAWLSAANGPTPYANGLPLAPASAEGRRTIVLAAAERALWETGKAVPTHTTLQLLDVHAPAQGPFLVRYTQNVEGIEVYGARTSVLLDRDLKPRAISGGANPPTRTDGSSAFVLTDTAALDSALAAVDETVASLAARPMQSDQTAYRRFALTASKRFVPSRAARVKPVWYPIDGDLTPAYHVEIVGSRPGADRPLAYALIISAIDGHSLHQHSLIHDLQPFAYRVFANSTGFPYVDPYGYTNPHPTGTPNGYLPSALAPMNLVSLSSIGISTGDPWLADNATETRGNNVDAFYNASMLDQDGYCDFLGYGPAFNASEGDYRAPLSGPGSFDYAYDINLQPLDYYQCLSDEPTPIPTDSPQFRAKIVQGFYAANWLHDYFYDLGYNEAAGNPQTDNYGRGGIANDPLIVHAGFDATFAFTPADGESPALSLGRNGLTSTVRDVSAFDFGVLAHEWAHTMFARLAGTNFYLGQEGALNEGTADFVGMFLTVREQDRFAAPAGAAFGDAYAVGAYMNRDYDYRPDPLPRTGTAGLADNTYYHGIRRFPTSVDLAVNPLTFKHIGVDHPLPASYNAYDWKARSLQNSEVHTAGEVWTAALWQCSRNILAASSSTQFDATKSRILRYLVAGLKTFPLDPTYIEARNALLFAIRADDEGNYRRCRSGFAERGFGAGAISPDRHSYSLRGALESFLDRDLAISIVDSHLEEVSGDGDGVLDRGETGRLNVTLLNSGFVPLSHLRLSVPALPGRYSFPAGFAVSDIALLPNQSTTISLAVKLLSNRPALNLPFVVHVRDTQQFEAQDLDLANFQTNTDLTRDATVDNLASAVAFAADWTRSFDGLPHGCAHYICSNDFEVASSFADMLDWQRVSHQGETAYKISDPHMAIGSSLETVAFTAAAPLRVKLRHSYDVDRQSAPPNDHYADPGLAAIELSIDGGSWESATPYLVSGSADFAGRSSGWRNDTLDFGSRLAGRVVRLRLHLVAGSSWVPDDVHWAISRVAVEGAVTPLFSTLRGDVN